MQPAIVDIERATEIAVEARGNITGSGHPTALIYLDAAVRSLRHAHAILIKADLHPATHVNPLVRTWTRITLADRMPTAVYLSPDENSYTWIRGTVPAGGGDITPFPGADVDWPLPMAVDLGYELLTSQAAKAISRAPVGAAMILDALANFSWFKPATASTWSTGVAGARSLVVTMAEGRAPPSLATELAGLRIDRTVLGVIEGLGWRLDPAGRSHALSAAFDGREEV